MKRVKTRFALVIPFEDQTTFVYPVSLRAVTQALRWVLPSEWGSIRILKEEADAFPGFSMGHACQMLRRNNPRYVLPEDEAKNLYYE